MAGYSGTPLMQKIGIKPKDRLLLLNAPKAFTPILALQRPFMPGEGWKSGLFWAPQLGWRQPGPIPARSSTAQREDGLAALISGKLRDHPPPRRNTSTYRLGQIWRNPRGKS